VALFESFPAFCATGKICAARDHPSPVAGTRNADGLCRETTALLSGLKLKPNTILALARLKDTRQVEVAREMREECRCSYQFARTLVAITPTDQLLRPHLRHVIAGRRGMYEAITREAIKIDQVYKAAQAEYPADAFALVALSAFARRLVDTEKFAPARKIAGARRLRELERVLADYAAWRAWKPSAPFGGDHAPS
jgi:hypothetical protein